MNIHVTANEAGRNTVFYWRMVRFFELMIEGIQKRELTKGEIIWCLRAFIKYASKTMKFKPTNEKTACIRYKQSRCV